MILCHNVGALAAGADATNVPGLAAAAAADSQIEPHTPGKRASANFHRPRGAPELG